jgi:hypothetical protein
MTKSSLLALFVAAAVTATPDIMGMPDFSMKPSYPGFGHGETVRAGSGAGPSMRSGLQQDMMMNPYAPQYPFMMRAMVRVLLKRPKRIFQKGALFPKAST